jgi:hypothetical protein
MNLNTIKIINLKKYILIIKLYLKFYNFRRIILEYLNNLFSEALKEEQLDYSINIMKRIIIELEKQFQKKENEENISLFWNIEKALLQLHWEYNNPTSIRFDLFFCEDNKENKKISTTFVHDIDKRNIDDNITQIEKTIKLLFLTYVKYIKQFI